MHIWKQLLTSIVVLCCGVLAWVWLAPGSAATLEKLGLPKAMIAAVAAREKPEAATGGAGQKAHGDDRTPLVVVRTVSQGIVNDRLNAIGSGEAIRSVTVTPQVSGTIVEIGIKSGDKVSQGQVLMRLDSDEQVIARDQARVALKNAEEKLKIYQNIKSTVSRLDVSNAEIARDTAKLALETAEFNLKRRTVTAPFDGIVGIVPVSIGDNVTSATTLVGLDDRSEILVDFWAPERFISQIALGGAVEASAIAHRGEIFHGVVDAIDNRVDPASRTFRVRARIDNGDDRLRSGMSFAVAMKFVGQSYPAVDPLSVQWDSQGSYVWRVADAKAEKVRVGIVQRNPEAVLVQADLRSGENIAIEGLLRIRENGGVRISGQPSDQQAEATP